VQDCITVLLNSGANVDVAEPAEGKTPLMIACERGFIESIDFLIEQEASVNQ
jgi:ankyrin repeat protein